MHLFQVDRFDVDNVDKEKTIGSILICRNWFFIFCMWISRFHISTVEKRWKIRGQIGYSKNYKQQNMELFTSNPQIVDK